MRLAIALAALISAAPMVASAGGLTVPVDQSRKLPIGGSAASIVVGNTAIADVKPIDSRTLMVIGKRQGVTNVVVLDGVGRTLYDGEVTVAAGAGSMVTVFRGAVAEEYACSPFCQGGGGGGSNNAGVNAAAPVSVAAPGMTIQAPTVSPSGAVEPVPAMAAGK